jgi:MFS family permease
VLLGLYLARLDFEAPAIGLVISAGLAGMTAALVLVTVAADRIGRRRTLVALAVLGGLGGLATVGLSSVAAVAVVAFLGMLNGQGRDRGAALVVEQAVLPATGTEQERTRIFAWYNVLQDVGHALGALLAALPTLLHDWGGIEDLAGMRATILLYGGLLLCTALLSAKLSPAIETVGSTEGRPQLSPESRRRLARISALFAIDSLAGGFLGSALVAYFFSERFGADAATIAALFVGARALNAVSH